MVLIVVVFPAPFGPRKPNISPCNGQREVLNGPDIPIVFGESGSFEYGHFLLSSMSEYKNFGADCTVPVVIVDIYSHVV